MSELDVFPIIWMTDSARSVPRCVGLIGKYGTAVENRPGQDRKWQNTGVQTPTE
jgi:hypothetical protein